MPERLPKEQTRRLMRLGLGLPINNDILLEPRPYLAPLSSFNEKHSDDPGDTSTVKDDARLRQADQVHIRNIAWVNVVLRQE